MSPPKKDKQEREALLVSLVKQYWRKAAKAMHPGASASMLLETLFPEQPFAGAERLPNIELGDEFITQLTRYQVKQSNEMLMRQLSVDAGLVDSNSIIIDIFHQNDKYTHGLLRAIATLAMQRFGDASEKRFLELAGNRFFGLTSSGLAPIGLTEDALRDIFQRQADENRNDCFYISFPLTHSDGVSISYPRNRPLVTIFGCLPFIDMYDLIAAHCAQHLVAGGVSSASWEVPGKILAGENCILSPEEYWRSYKEFLDKRSGEAAHESETVVTPGNYRNFLAIRQRLRDNRLRMLGPYTGQRRKTATEQDLLAAPYPLFFRLAEEIVKQAGVGVASIASRPEYLKEGGAKAMHKRLCAEFTDISITDLVDDTVKRTADGAYQTDVPVGLAVCTMAKSHRRALTPGQPRHVDVWYLDNRPLGANLLIAPLMPIPPNADSPLEYTALRPAENNEYAFRPPAMSEEYQSWPSIVGIYRERFTGLMEKRGGALHDIDKERLAERMRRYFDRNISWSEYAATGNGMADEYNRFNPKATRAAVLRTEQFEPGKIQPYLLRPFDVRWCYYSSTRPLWHEPRASLEAIQHPGNHFLVVRSNQIVADEGVPLFFTSHLLDVDLLRGHTYCMPAWRTDGHEKRVANLSDTMRVYLKELGILANATAEDAALLVHWHILAIGFAPAYLHENRLELGQEWPRIPFPGFDQSKPPTVSEANAAFRASAELGRRVAALLQGERTSLQSPRNSTIDDLTDFARLHDTAARGAKDKDERRFIVDQEWGKPFGKGGVLPSHGRLSVREYSPDERRMIETIAREMGIHAGAAYSLLGHSTRDIYLNPQLAIHNIPANVWEYTVGGYPVLKKWLSYRETKIMKQALTAREIDDFRRIVKRLVQLQLLGHSLNRNYSSIRDSYRACRPKALAAPCFDDV